MSDPLVGTYQLVGDHNTYADACGIAFNVPSYEEIIGSSVLGPEGITEANLVHQNEPMDNSLNDLRMGPCSAAYLCSTCFQTIEHCGGHGGHLIFKTPLFDMEFMRPVIEVLSCVCKECSRPVLNYKDAGTNPIVAKLMRIPVERRWSAWVRASKQCALSGCRCGVPYNAPGYDEDTIQQLMLDRKICGASYPEWSSRGIQVLHRITYITDKGRAAALYKDPVPVSAARVFDILNYIQQDELDAMGFAQRGNDAQHMPFGRFSVHHARDLIVRAMYIPPPAARLSSGGGLSASGPSAAAFSSSGGGSNADSSASGSSGGASGGGGGGAGGGGKGEDQLTQLLRKLIKENIKYDRLQQRDDVTAEQLEKQTEALQIAYCKVIKDDPTKRRGGQLISSSSSASSSSAQTGGTAGTVQTGGQHHGAKNRMKKEARGSINGRMRGKNGRFRKDGASCRPNANSRTVIDGTAMIPIDEIWVPLEIARTMTKVVECNRWNAKTLTQCVLNGPFKFPGALRLFYPPDRVGAAQPVFDLEFEDAKRFLDPATGLLPHGVHVERFMMDGDSGIFNRPPSLHKWSTLGKKARIHKGRNFMFHTCTASGHHADFDGDEMQFGATQSLLAEAEIELMQVGAALIDAKNQAPVYGMIQDMIMGANLLTQKNRMLTRAQACMLIAWGGMRVFDKNNTPLGAAADDYDDRWTNLFSLPRPAILKPQELWTGKQIVSMFLPDVTNQDVAVDDGKVVVVHGQILKGELMKKGVGSNMSSLIKRVEEMYSQKVASEWLEKMSWLTTRACNHYGYSLGFKDIVAPPALTRELQVAMKEAEDRIKSYYTEWMRTKSNLAKHACKVEMQNVRNRASKLIANHVSSRTNNVMKCIEVGARGDESKLVQMMGPMGPQIVSGDIIQRSMEGRIFPHFKRGENIPVAIGNVQNSLSGGLSPHAMFVHAMAGMEGLAHTSVGTSKSGYLTRKLRKTLENATASHMQSVLQSNRVLALVSGGDGLDSQALTHVHIARSWLFDMSNDEFLANHGFVDCDATSCEYVLGARCLLQQFVLHRDYKVGQLSTCLILPFNPFQLVKARECCDYDVLVRRYAKTRSQQLVLRSCYRNNLTWHSWMLMVRKDVCALTNGRLPVDVLMAVVAVACAPKHLPSSWFMNATRQQDESVLLQMQWLHDQIVSRYRRAIINPHEPEGNKAASAMGEPGTQMSLDAFHFSGLDVQHGIPRFDAVSNCQQPKQYGLERMTIMKVYLNPAIEHNLLVVRELARSLPHLTLARVMTGYALCKYGEWVYNPSVERTMRRTHDVLQRRIDNVVLASCRVSSSLTTSITTTSLHSASVATASSTDSLGSETPTQTATTTTTTTKRKRASSSMHVNNDDEQQQQQYNNAMQFAWSTTVVCIQLDELQCLRMNTTPHDLAHCLKMQLGPDVEVVACSMADPTWVLHVRFLIPACMHSLEVMAARMLMQHMVSLELGGIAGIFNTHIMEDTRVVVRPDGAGESKRMYWIQTSGSNLRRVLGLRLVDASRTICSDMTETHDVFGIYGAQSFFAREYPIILNKVGFNDPRHSMLLSRVQTCTGQPVKITRNGIGQHVSSTLHLCFEDPLRRISRAAVGAPVEMIEGASDATILGTRPPIGTGAVKLLKDKPLEAVLRKEAEDKYAALMVQKQRQEKEEQQQKQQRQQYETYVPQSPQWQSSSTAGLSSSAHGVVPMSPEYSCRSPSPTVWYSNV